jgi:hypothetical protein
MIDTTGGLRRAAALALAVLGCAALAMPAAGQGDGARARVRAGLEAMGGEAKLRALTGVRVAGIGHRNLLEQSERPEGPWIAAYEQVDELRDLAKGRVRQSYQQRYYGAPEWWGYTRLLSDGVAAMARGERMGPGRRADAAELGEPLALGPERVLLTALDAADLRAAADTTVHGVPHHVAVFGWRGARVRLFLNAHTSLPTAVETLRAEPDDPFWGVWGDVARRTYFSMWEVQPGGVRYPRQWDVQWNGYPSRSFSVTKVDLAAAAPDDSFAVTPQVREAYTRAAAAPDARRVRLGEGFPGRPAEPAVNVADGVVVLPGRWYAALVRQADGVVILEAPISPEYSAQVLAEAARRFPGVPVKAVVSTSDAWPHVGGVPEYVARGVPVYALDLNRPLLERLAAAPFTLAPDSLARAPRAAEFREVSGRMTIGSGPNRIELVPARGEGSERMLLAYLPGRRLLYASDLLQKMPDGSFFTVEYPLEVAEAVRRERLDVDTVFAMHLSPIPFCDVTAFVARATSAAVVAGN